MDEAQRGPGRRQPRAHAIAEGGVALALGRRTDRQHRLVAEAIVVGLQEQRQRPSGDRQARTLGLQAQHAEALGQPLETLVPARRAGELEHRLGHQQHLVDIALVAALAGERRIRIEHARLLLQSRRLHGLDGTGRGQGRRRLHGLRLQRNLRRRGRPDRLRRHRKRRGRRRLDRLRAGNGLGNGCRGRRHGSGLHLGRHGLGGHSGTGWRRERRRFDGAGRRDPRLGDGDAADAQEGGERPDSDPEMLHRQRPAME